VIATDQSRFDVKKLGFYLAVFAFSNFFSDWASAVSLRDACVEALSHSRLLKASEESLKSVRFRYKALKAERWPSLYLTSQARYSSSHKALNSSPTNAGWTNGAGLELAWTIWDGCAAGCR
jgi:outer membrane protein TolC